MKGEGSGRADIAGNLRTGSEACSLGREGRQELRPHPCGLEPGKATVGTPRKHGTGQRGALALLMAP